MRDLGSNHTSSKDLQGERELGIATFHICEMGLTNPCLRTLRSMYFTQ